MSLKRFRGGAAVNNNVNPGASTSGSTRILHEAVVTNFFSNPAEDLEKNPPNDPDNTYRQSMKKGVNKVTNPQLIASMPRSSVTAIVTSDSAALSESKPEIFYPLFPHLTMPVKAGEKIWVIYETVERDRSSRGYWVCRVKSDLKVDDPNYTHNDRQFLYKSVPAEKGPLAAAEGTSDFDSSIVYGFLAGSSGDASENTLQGKNPYDEIVVGSDSYINQFSGEAVPRFSPRMGDLVLEGSNNTLICLGQDRRSLAGTVVDESEGSDIGSLRTGLGTIDIVVGRGQEEDTAIEPVSVERSTESTTVSYEEGNKFLEFDDAGTTNLLEGDLDFTNDLSRVYVSMNTSGDENFGLEFTDTSASQVAESPYVIAKSTEIRLVSREGGSIRMMKEGSSDQAEICITSDGKIVIEGTASATAKNYPFDGTASARTSQKVIRGEDLVSALKDFSKRIDTALSQVPGEATTVGNMGGPIVDGDGEVTGIRAAVSKLAKAAEEALSGEVFIK